MIMLTLQSLRLRCAVFFLFILGIGPAIAQTDFGAVDTMARTAVERGEIPAVAYGIARDGHILHTAAFGHADRERKVRATVHTAFPLASLTKPITATALLVLHEQTSLPLDTSLSELLPLLAPKAPSKDPWHDVTLTRLLHHTAGIGTYARIYYGDEIANAPEYPASLRDYAAPVQPPGLVAEYSNLGYGLLGEVIAQHSGKSFAVYVHRNVFDPLQMHDAFIAESSTHRSAVGYDANLVRLPALWNDTPGAGNAYASVDDLLRFGSFHLSPAQAGTLHLAPHTVAAMRDRDADGARHPMYGDAWYGEGWYVRGAPATPKLIWHEGGMPGASTLLALYPGRGLVVTVLVNRSDAQSFVQTLADQLAHGVDEGAPELALNPTVAFSPLTGSSAFAGNWRGNISVDGEKRLATIKIDVAGNASLTYIAEPGEAPVTREFHAMTSNGSLITAVQGPWRSRGATVEASALLLKLVLTDDGKLQGALVAYAAPGRLRFLLPYAVAMQRTTPP